MNIFRLLFELFLFYMLYKLIFHFIVPVYRASKRMKANVEQMKQKMHEQQQQQASQQNFNAVKPDAKNTEKPDKKDYIDFEEIKK